MEPPEEPVSGEKLAKGSPSKPKPAPARASPRTRAKAPPAKNAPKAAKKAAQIPPKAVDPVDAAGEKEQERPRVDGAAACSASQPLQPVTEAGETPSPSCPPDGAREELSQPQLPVMEPAQPSSLPPAKTPLPPESPLEEPAAKALQVAASVSPRERLPAMEPPKKPVSGEKVDLAAPKPGMGTGSPSTPKPVPARALPKTQAKAPLAKKVLPTKKATKKAVQIPPKTLDPVGTAGGKEQERPLVDGAAACSASQTAQPSSLPPASTPLPPESPSEEPAAKRAKPATPEAAVPSPESPEPEMTPEMRRIISEAIAQGIAAGIQQHRPAVSANALCQGQAPPSSMSIQEAPLVVVGAKELPPSEDNEGSPDAQGFVGLFSPALFKTLLQNAKAAAGIEADPATSDPALSDPNNLLFSEPVTDKEEIPCPKFFLDVVDRQWAVPGARQPPDEIDKRLYNVGPKLAAALKIPTVDGPVAALASSPALYNEAANNLKAEDRNTELMLRRAHQSAAWTINSAVAASFFNRISLLWLKEMQARIPATDHQSHQDLNNLIAAAEFSADATLNTAKFASRAIGSSVTTRRLLWLRYWQSDMRLKWKLACSPFKGDKLFGEVLEPLLIETKDKKKVLPSISKRAGQRSLPYFRKASFRAADTAGDNSQLQRAFSQRPDRSGYGDRSRKQFQSKQPVRGNRSQSSPRSSRGLQSQASRGPAATRDCSPQGFEEMESYCPPNMTQQASGIQEIQNPIHEGDQGGRHPDLNRSHRSIPTHSYIGDSPMVSMDMQREAALPVQSPREDSSYALGSPQDYPYSRPTVSGRRVDRIVLSPPRQRGSTHHDPGPSGSFRESEIHSQQLQEPLVSYRQDAPPSSISRRDNMHSLPVPDPTGQHQGSSKLNPIVPNIASRPRLTIVKQDGVLRLLCSRGKSAYQDLTMVPPAYPEIRQEQFSYQRPSPNRGPAVVDVTDDNQGMPIPGTEPSYYSYGRQYARLESPDRDPDGRRPVDTRGMTNQHQPATDASRPFSPPTDPDDHLRPPRTYPSRECNRQSPYDPPREHPLEDIDYRRQDPIRSPPVVDVTKHNQRMGIQETELSHHRSGGRFSRPESPDRDPDARRPVDRSRTTNQCQPVRAQIRPRSSQKDPDHHRWTPRTDSSRKRKK
ncbi:uncharacterized protein LOC116519935 isoform X2 [Thamnophis elegans]|uniref:uncharacterized protein LOC116519935 isoform X2 n=1 Tax=Thamnophis elegans TaxID=35005 RepID=UPI0013791099|nr:uncharacterized protein LOC116519935 isoform X2 [Thamnophis elegans]